MVAELCLRSINVVIRLSFGIGITKLVMNINCKVSLQMLEMATLMDNE